MQSALSLMTSTDPMAWLILAKAPGIGPVRVRQLLQQFNTPEAIINAPVSALSQAKCPESARRWLKQAQSKEVLHELEWLQKPNNHLITILDENYPTLLRNLHDAPPLLFAKGHYDTLNLPQLAIVGSRNPSMDGKQSAEQFADYLATGGLTITSGLAQGIDAHAHRGALKHGRTIAVCATGLDIIYPQQHIQLATDIEQGGCLVSEFLPGTTARREFFPRRNRLISGLSLGTLVVEAGIKSGSLITAHMALEQGREVFAIPGSIHNPLAKGCHKLIQSGAKLVDTAQDIVNELQNQFQSLHGLIGHFDDASNRDSVKTQAAQIELDEEYQLLLQALDHRWLSVDEIVEASQLKTEHVSSMLLILELENRVLSDGNGRYRIV